MRDIHSEAGYDGEDEFWKRKLMDLDDFHRFRNELNLSLDAAAPARNGENALLGDYTNKPVSHMPLEPRVPYIEKNNKDKNKRASEKPKP